VQSSWPWPKLDPFFVVHFLQFIAAARFFAATPKDIRYRVYGVRSPPIFEADLPSEQYGYRKDRSALDAERRIHALVNKGHREIVDADLSSYFDEVPTPNSLSGFAAALRTAPCYIC
jgi:hypothetical protein